MTEPDDAVRVTLSPSGSEKVPVFAAGEPSFTDTAAWSPPTAGGPLGTMTFVTTHVWKARSRVGEAVQAQPWQASSCWPPL